MLRDRWLRVILLPPPWRPFFFIASLLHVLFKVILGLYWVAVDGYGLQSFMAPPLSVLLATPDILVCYVLALLGSFVIRDPKHVRSQSVLLLALALCLSVNFVVHAYLKSFVDYGLLRFNGAGLVELFDYFLQGLRNLYASSFVALALLLVVLFPRLQARMLNGSPGSGVAAFAVFLLAVPTASSLGRLSAGQSGFLRRNPLFDLAESTWKLRRMESPRSATPAELRAFHAPTPIFGHYDTRLDVSLPSYPRANVLFLLIESLPIEQTPLEGRESALSSLRTLAERGITFTQFRTVFPATTRSFTTYHCGQYPNTGPAAIVKYQPGYACDSFLDVLKSAGYRTGFFTASMFSYDNVRRAAFVHGYDTFRDFFSLSEHAKRGGVLDQAVEEEAVVDAVDGFAKADPTVPFFATYFVFWDHSPYRLPFEDISALPPLERYHRTLQYIDAQIRELLRRLAPVMDDTIVIVAADHGEGFGLHHDNKCHNGQVFEDDLRIPLVIAPPRWQGAVRTARIGSNVDFAPTLTALLGLPAMPTWTGQDLLSRTYQPRPQVFFSRSAFFTNGILDGDQKFFYYADSGEERFYDLATDPHEQHNIAKVRGTQIARYRALLDRWLPVIESHAASKAASNFPQRAPNLSGVALRSH